MNDEMRIVVVGGAVAAASFVSQLRSDGFTGTITVVDQDPDAPYDRPPLSKEFLTDQAAAPEAPWWTGECRLITGSAVGLNVGASSITVHHNRGGSEQIEADHIVLATGAAPVRIPGLHRDVLHFRTAADARLLRRHLHAGLKLTILGAGTIGTELASSATEAGADVTLIDVAPKPLERFLGGHLTDQAEAWIREGGVDLRLGTRVEAVGKHAGRWVVTTDSGVVDADVVLSAVGTRPSVSWLSGSGLDKTNGVRCDRDGTALDESGSPVPNVHAIGDVAAWPDRFGLHRRHEDWTTAQRQGRHLAQVLLGLESTNAPETQHKYFWTHQFGRRIQILGSPDPEGDLITQMTNPDSRASFHTVEQSGRAEAWIAINAPREFALATRDSLLNRPLTSANA